MTFFFIWLIHILYACLYVLKFLRVGENCDMYMLSRTYICVHMFCILNYFTFNTFLLIFALPYISSTCSYMTDILILKMDFEEYRKPRYLHFLSFQVLYKEDTSILFLSVLYSYSRFRGVVLSLSGWIFISESLSWRLGLSLLIEDRNGSLGRLIERSLILEALKA